MYLKNYYYWLFWGKNCWVSLQTCQTTVLQLEKCTNNMSNNLHVFVCIIYVCTYVQAHMQFSRYTCHVGWASERLKCVPTQWEWLECREFQITANPIQCTVCYTKYPYKPERWIILMWILQIMKRLHVKRFLLWVEIPSCNNFMTQWDKVLVHSYHRIYRFIIYREQHYVVTFFTYVCSLFTITGITACA